VVAQRKRLKHLRKTRDRGIGKGHSTPVYGVTQKRRKIVPNDLVA
jgi:hypothetical protein